MQDEHMTNDLLVRPVTRQDYDQWLPLWDGYNAFYGRSGPTALAADITRTTWERFFDAYEPVNALVAESGGQLLGLTHYIFHRSTISIAPNCYLQDLFTNEAARGKGVPSRLLAHPRDQSHRHGTLQQSGGSFRLCSLSKDVLNASLLLKINIQSQG
jgi:GNAT superfamily N-acetyltransferase